ncbi:MAG: DNA mismatch repair endonuclease MutL [bacterium]
MPIQILSQNLINKIAAGEVVERPASVVKELIENAIDAKANTIIIEIEQGGITSITVKDNGMGMNEPDAQLALIQHATSKLQNETDLNQIITLGFRGEALASIASISDTEIHTFDGNTKPLLITSTQKNISVITGTARNQGTTVIVRNIFKYIPARRKFLRSPHTEFKYILEIFISLAIIHPEIEIQLLHNAKKIFQLQKTSSLQRIIEIFPEFQNRLLTISNTSENLKLSGFIGHPSTASSTAKAQYIFLNNRTIKDNIIRKAAKEGFSSSIMPSQFPVYFLFCEINPEEVDVNIHPRKLEVRFSAPGQIFKIVKETIQTNLEKSIQHEFQNKLKLFHSEKHLPAESPLNELNNLTPKLSQVRSSIDFTKTLLKSDLPVFNQNTRQIPDSDLKNITYQTQNFPYLQIFLTYLILEKAESLLIIDQHAAAERINFEKLKKQSESHEHIHTQKLLLPEKFHVNHKEENLLVEFNQKLKEFGFLVISDAAMTWKILEIPLLLIKQDYVSTMRNLLADLDSSNAQSSKSLDEQNNLILATIACHSSIRAGQKLEPLEIKQLISDLFRCTLPYSCPHGRPLSWEISKNELERQFKRII